MVNHFFIGTGVYAQVVRRFADLGAQWLQLDEPYLVMDIVVNHFFIGRAVTSPRSPW